MRHWQRLLLGLVAVGLFSWTISGSQPDLTEYRSPEKAVAAKIVKADVVPLQTRSFLGVHVGPDADGWLVVNEVAAHSPAAKAGLQSGDQLILADGVSPKNDAALLDLLNRKSPGETVALLLSRKGKRVELTATLTALSRPVIQGKQLAVLGVDVVKAKVGEGMAIEQIAPGSPAEKAALKIGEIILKVENVALTHPEKLTELLAARKPGDTLTLTLAAAEKTIEKKIVLGGALVTAQPERKGKGFDFRNRYWTKPAYRLGIILVEYPDEKHNANIPPKAWEDSMFSKGSYNKTSVTGQTVYGSMNDHYLEQSFGKLHIEGKAFAHVLVSKKRGEYATGKRDALLVEAMDKILARDGKDAFKDLDGVFFIYSGESYPSPRGSLYWPHRASVSHQGKSWPYFICPELAKRTKNMLNISVFSHEFGHMVGLPDLYARPENPGMEGVGVWCLMANQLGNGRPQHMCAWSKEKLGWVTPTVIDPTVKQKLVLAPIEDSPKECFKVLVRRDGSEYLLLENRAQKGFDKGLPAGGLLIWRVVGGRPVLEESHGVEGPQGPNVFQTSVPFPSASNDAFTPYTVPSSQSKLGGGLPVHITNIRRLPDGRITFHIGYEYQ